VSYALLVALSLFYGFAFEEFYSDFANRPGGVRTFPLLAFAGAALYLIEPHYALAFIAGLLVIGVWLFAYVRENLELEENRVEKHFLIPAAVLIAYVLGAVCLTQPPWFSVGVTVASVLLITSRKPLHALVSRVPSSEIWKAGQFLLLVGVVAPLLYNEPPIPFTHITPFKVWLAVIAVSTLSYGSYLVQRYVLPGRGIIVTALLGGLYSSTATTVVLAREAHEAGFTAEISGGVIAATAMMYLRIIIVCALFNGALAGRLVVPFVVLAALAAVPAYLLSRRSRQSKQNDFTARNPLALATALLFAVLLIVISILTDWVVRHLGTHGVLALAAVVGFTDIDPFVLSLAQGGAAATGLAVAAAAIMIASSSNNVLKAVYAVAFSRRRESAVAAGLLLLFAALGVAFALFGLSSRGWL